MENIKVALRVRPLSDAERMSQEENVFDIINNEHITVNRQFIKELINTKRMNLTTKISYTFDLCFDQDASNLNVFDQSVLTVSESVIHGINSTIFMYGQTGSGKTYTTLGPIGDSLNQNNPLYYQKSLQNLKQMEYDGDLGVLLLAMNHILNSIQANKEKTFCVKCSYFEIYNENVYDLLKSKNTMDEALQLSENHSKKDFVIKGLREVEIQCIEDILDVIYQGEENRHYAETILNHSSSRSHTIFKLYVYSYANDQIAKYRQKNASSASNGTPNSSSNNSNGHFASMSASSLNINNQQLLEFADNHPNTLITESCLNFVDLAGSEKISNHHQLIENFSRDVSYSSYTNEEQSSSALKNARERIKESQSINKSLFFLTQVIQLQSSNKSLNHIPYRNSALTKILKSSLGGNSRTLIILCVTPTSMHFDQSLSTMRFGQSAKKIKNNISVNIRRDLYHAYQQERSTDNISLNNILQPVQVDFKITLFSDFNSFTVEQENAELKEDIEALKKQVIEIVEEKGEILRKLKALMKRQIDVQENDTSDEINAMLPVQLHQQAGVIFHTSQTLKNNKIYASIDKDVCNLLYDYEGKIALRLAQKLKSQLDSYLQRERILQSNFSQIQHHYLAICNDLMDSKEDLTNFKWRYTVIEKKYKELREAAEGALRRLDLYENMMGISDLSNEELKTIETQLMSALEKLRLEQSRRVFKDEISHLKTKLGLKQLNQSTNQHNSYNPHSHSSSTEGEINYNAKVVMEKLAKEISEPVVEAAKFAVAPTSNQQQRSQNLDYQKDLIRSIFYQNVKQKGNNGGATQMGNDNDSPLTTSTGLTQEQKDKLSQIEQLMLQNASPIARSPHSFSSQSPLWNTMRNETTPMIFKGTEIDKVQCERDTSAFLKNNQYRPLQNFIGASPVASQYPQGLFSNKGKEQIQIGNFTGIPSLECSQFTKAQSEPGPTQPIIMQQQNQIHKLNQKILKSRQSDDETLSRYQPKQFKDQSNSFNSGLNLDGISIDSLTKNSISGMENDLKEQTLSVTPVKLQIVKNRQSSGKQNTFVTPVASQVKSFYFANGRGAGITENNNLKLTSKANSFQKMNKSLTTKAKEPSPMNFMNQPDDYSHFAQSQGHSSKRRNSYSTNQSTQNSMAIQHGLKGSTLLLQDNKEVNSSMSMEMNKSIAKTHLSALVNPLKEKMKEYKRSMNSFNLGANENQDNSEIFTRDHEKKQKTQEEQAYF